MVPLNYRHLYYFWAVAKAGSIAAARERLRLSQPTLSSQLKALERACKASFFDRGKKGMSLTARGRTVFDYCERIFAPGEELAALLRGGFSAPPILRVGIETRVPKEAVIHLLEFARGRDRHVRVNAANACLEELAAGLQRQTLDLAVSCEELPPLAAGHARKRLAARLPVGFVASPAVSRRVTRFPSQLSKVPMLFRTREHPIRKEVDRYLGKHGVIPLTEAELEDADVIRQLAVKGRGVAALNLLAAEPDLRAGRLVRLDGRSTGIEEPIWFACSGHASQNAAVAGLVDALMESFELRLAERTAR
ncbi:MAG: LysR family transcriptional regulator [Elusimicrobia bacterium]|nr:LysR family transcriptional regulator [Elusimicrobiota bacterium]